MFKRILFAFDMIIYFRWHSPAIPVKLFKVKIFNIPDPPAAVPATSDLSSPFLPYQGTYPFI
jgi:hypothetical protein